MMVRAQLLIKAEQKYNISVDLLDGKIGIFPNWNKYLTYKIKEGIEEFGNAEIMQEALIRLDVNKDQYLIGQIPSNDLEENVIEPEGI